jgi:octaprenyl-diphosphate synthase
MRKGTDAERQMIRHAIQKGGLDKLDDIQAVIESTGALAYTASQARKAADLAIDALQGVPESEYKQAMITIADFAVRRRS